MASRKRQSVVGYAGVYFVEVPRSTGHGLEKVYYIRYRKQGKLIEESRRTIPRQHDRRQSSSIRGLRMEGKDASNEEKRIAVRAAKMAEESRYSFNRLWSLFEEAKSSNRSIKDDRIRFNLHIAPSLGTKSIPELTIHDIDKLRAKLEKRQVSADRQARSDSGQTHTEFRLAEGYVDFIPGTLRITMPTVDNKVTENLTHEQVQNLLKALDEEPDQTLASLVRLALFTGMRRSAFSTCNGKTLILSGDSSHCAGPLPRKAKRKPSP